MTSSSSLSAPPARPEYQHFVPQFLLRNFAHRYRLPRDANAPRRGGRGRRGPTGVYSGQKVVNRVNLLADPFVLEEVPIKRVLGLEDMYQDSSQPAGSSPKQSRRIETLLGELEAKASALFCKITEALENTTAEVWLTRSERNRLRRFLFLLKYRGSSFHRRFYGVSTTTATTTTASDNDDEGSNYVGGDQELLREYMQSQRFARPADVWLDNIAAIAELDMDCPDEEWMAKILTRMYPPDAMWFVSHAQQMYMALCTPEDAGSEFLLTDNSYGVYEGPSVSRVDPAIGRQANGAWLNFHEFAPVAPRVMIVLRSFLLPDPDEDSNADVRAMREGWRRLAIDAAFSPDTTSTLADLPVRKARNNYSKVVNGQVRLTSEKEDWKRGPNDRFCFRFFRLGARHVDRINGYLLENAAVCTSVVYKSRPALTQTLESYLTMPCGDGHKRVAGPDRDRRLRLLRGLAALLAGPLGRPDARPVWDEAPPMVPLFSEWEKMQLMNAAMEEMRPDLTEKLKESRRNQSKSAGGEAQVADPLRLYYLLGTSPQPHCLLSLFLVFFPLLMSTSETW